MSRARANEAQDVYRIIVKGTYSEIHSTKMMLKYTDIASSWGAANAAFDYGLLHTEYIAEAFGGEIPDEVQSAINKIGEHQSKLNKEHREEQEVRPTPADFLVRMLTSCRPKTRNTPLSESGF